MYIKTWAKLCIRKSDGQLERMYKQIREFKTKKKD